MARSCGIRIGPRRFELIVLDGSPKNHKITAYKASEFPRGGSDPEADAAALLAEAAKEFSIPRENVGIAIDAGHAAYRKVRLPITDTSKIDQVLKYEVESQLPQWNIDDVIVDWQVLSQTDEHSDLLVTAVPKTDLQHYLGLCEGANIEVLEAELETSAMVNAASAADLCHPDDAQLLVHIGDYSTSVVVMDAGEVREMRVIHIGGLTHEVTDAAEAESEAPESNGEDVDVEAHADADADAENGLDDEGEPLGVDSIEVARRLEQSLKRIRRELGRTLSGARTLNPVEAIYVCGMDVPGLVGSTVLDVPVYVLDCFVQDGGQPVDGFGSLVAAYGVAYRQLGGGALSPSLRREEMRYSGAMERIEFPLAVACLLLCTFLGVVNILQFREKGWLSGSGVMTWLMRSNYELVANRRLDPVPDDIRTWAKQFEKGFPEEGRTPIESLEYLKRDLTTKVTELQSTLGQSADIIQPQSAFMGSMLVLGVLGGNDDWRPSLRRVRGTYQPGRQRRPDTVKVTIDITFFANDTLAATRHYEAFEQELRTQPWFVDFDKKPSDELPDGRGINIRGMPITVDVSKHYEQELASREG